jgi:hypothetical protein
MAKDKDENGEKPKTVTVEALQWHTYDGKEYAVGDTYEIDEALADSVAAQGKAIRTDRAEVAKKAEKDAAKAKE